MNGPSLPEQLRAILEGLRVETDASIALVCADDGLALVSVGDDVGTEPTAATVALFDDLVARGRRDLGMTDVDEVTMLDPRRGRLVIRAIPTQATDPARPSFFLVFRLAGRSAFRRAGNAAGRRLAPVLDALLAEAA